MANKKVLLKNEVNKVNPIITPTVKKDSKNKMSEKVEEKKEKKPLKKSSALLIASKERSAVGAVKARSSRDVRGSSGLANTGTIISYD